MSYQPLVKLLISSCLCVFSMAGIASADLRNWTDTEGRSIEATPLSKTDSEITVRRNDGLVFTIPLSRLSDGDRDWIANWEAPEVPAADIEDAVVLIETPRSRGTGFLATFSDGVFLVTNQHVIDGAAQQEIKVTTLRGQRLALRSLEVSPTQDLARLSVSAPAGLRVRNETAHEAEIIAYGNSGGGGVATTNRGKVVGVSHDVLEVTAEIVQGNSGGPVVDTDGYAIGVASFVTVERKNPEDWVTHGTRYESPRRFAIRLRDDLEWRQVDWGSYVRETRHIRNTEQLLDQAIELARAIIANPTESLGRQNAYPESLQDVIRSHNQHVRRFTSTIGTEVSNRAAVRRANQSQNAAYRARLRRITEVLTAEVKSFRSGRPPPSTPYLAERMTAFETAVTQVNASIEDIMKVELTFFVLDDGR